MDDTNRRQVLGGMALGLGTVLSTQLAHADTPLNPSREPGVGGTDPGPRNLPREAQNPDIINPPATDHGTLPNLRFSYADSHIRQESGGWTRQITERELGISKSIAGVNMRLNSGGVRELHWHKESEWAYMIYGSARLTAIDQDGNSFVGDVKEGDLWFFPSGMPHSIQGLGPDGCEFLLVFDSGGFDEESTFLLSDWFKHVPPEVLAKNFGVDKAAISHTRNPDELYIFTAPLPGALKDDVPTDVPQVPNSFMYSLMGQEPIKLKNGTVRVVDSHNFPASKTIAAALVEVQPGAMRELHWHPNTDEWQYYLEGKGRMGVFAASGQARTFDFQAGDVGYVPYAMGHYIENTGDTPLRFLEMFKSDYYADLSLDQWLALTPKELVKEHLGLDDQTIAAFQKTKSQVVPR